MEQKYYRRRLRTVLNEIYKDSDRTEIGWKYVEKDILYLIDNAKESNEDAYVLYAKYFYERKFYKRSVEYFLYILSNCPNKKEQCLYGLMKNYILLENYNEAFNCLLALKEFMVTNNRENVADFGFIEALLGFLNEENVNLEVEPSRYMYSKIEDEQVLISYSEILDSVIELDFDNASNKCQELNNFVKQNKLEFDFLPLCMLLNACAKKQKQNMSLELK